jgi:hypothetical protein
MVAYGLWEAAQMSGQADFYQDTDWWTLYFACDQITYLYESGKRSPEFLKGILSMLNSLMFTEADRRKAHIELAEREDEAEDAAVAALADYRAALEVVPTEHSAPGLATAGSGGAFVRAGRGQRFRFRGRHRPPARNLLRQDARRTGASGR